MEGGGGGRVVTCGRWIKRPENVNLVVLGKSFRRSSTKSTIEIFSYDSETTSLSSSPLATCDIEEGEPVSIAVHPTGDEIVCSTSAGDCKLFELSGRETDVKLLAKELPCLQGVGVQKCIAFSIDGSRLASGGADGHLRIFEWPSLRVVLDEPRAHKSFRDMDFSLDSEFLASTSTDGSARIWNANVGIPVTNLRRNSDEKIELCRFSQDGTRPFLFCAVQRGDKSITGVWDMSTWDKIGHKRLLKKPASTMSTSMDGKYLALGSRDGDFCVVEVKKMEIHHWSRRLHPGTSIASLEFCPTQRAMKRFGEDVCHLFTILHKRSLDLTPLNVFSDDVIIKFYILGSFMKHHISHLLHRINHQSSYRWPHQPHPLNQPQFHHLQIRYGLVMMISAEKKSKTSSPIPRR